MCAGKNFPAKYVIHVNSPTWSSGNASQQLDTAVKNILKLADEKNLKSVALPSIGSGKYASFQASNLCFLYYQKKKAFVSL